MKKSFLFLSAIASTFLFFSCMGGNKSNATAENGMSQKDANGIIKYYDLSLSQLKNLVNEKEINAILGLMDQRGQNPVAPAYTPFAISPTDSVMLMNPDSCFNDATRQSLKQNYQGLFNARILFYTNYEQYRNYIDSKGYKKDNYTTAAKLLNDSYDLSVKLAEFKQVIFDELSFVTSEADKVALADNPMKEQLMAERMMKLSMQKIVNLFAAKKVDETKLDKEKEALQKQYDAAVKLPAITGHENEKQSFRNFLSKTEVFIKALNKIREDQIYSDVQYFTLNSAFETSID